MSKKFMSISTAVISASLLLASAVTVQAAGDGSLDRIKEAGSVTICTSNDVPYAYKDPSTGEFSGVDVDMVRAIFSKLGITNVEMYNIEFSGLIPALQSKRCDLIADNMGISPPRSEQINFSWPMYNAGLVIAVSPGNPKKIMSVDDFKGNTVGAYLGTIQLEWMKQMAEKDPSITVKAFKGVPEIIAEMRAGRLDAAVTDGMVLSYMLKADPTIPLEVVDHQLKQAGGRYAVGAGFRKEDNDLRYAFDDAHRQGQLSGEFNTILAKWGLEPKTFYAPFENCCVDPK